MSDELVWRMAADTGRAPFDVRPGSGIFRVIADWWDQPAEPGCAHTEDGLPLLAWVGSPRLYCIVCGPRNAPRPLLCVFCGKQLPIVSGGALVAFGRLTVAMGLCHDCEKEN